MGPLDEDMSFNKVQLNDAKEIVLNFEHVNGIKSFGIRELIRWLGSYKSAKIIYSRCPKIVVDQINIVDGFLPRNAFVESFFVPYYSEATGEETQVLFRYGHEFDGANVTPPGDIVDSQGNKMEMDAIWDKYFRFLDKKAKKRSA
jgi:hypothetical protein